MAARLMKNARFITLLAVLFSLGCPAHADFADGVQAIVNDTVITRAQVEQLAGPAIDALRTQYANQPEAFQTAFDATIGDTLTNLVERQLILHSFDVEGYKLPDNIIDDVMQDRIREQFGDRVTMIKTLQARGETLEEFRKMVRDQYIEQAMRNQNVSREIIISPYKVQTYYQAHLPDYKVEDEVKLRMITLNKNSDTGANALDRARDILAQIKNGATFDQMAKAYSQDAQQHTGGDRGWVERSVLRNELANAAFALKPGQTSDVVDLPEACYLLHVEDARPAHVKPLSDVRDDIEKILRAQEQTRLENQWIQSLWKKTFIRFF